MILLDVYEELLAKAEEMFGPRNPAYTLELIGFSFAGQLSAALDGKRAEVIPLPSQFGSRVANRN